MIKIGKILNERDSDSVVLDLPVLKILPAFVSVRGAAFDIRIFFQVILTKEVKP